MKLQAETFMHEMFHIDRISSSPPNTHVTDLWVQIRPNLWFQVFGPELSKALARTTRNTGQYVMQTAENLMYFAMVTHYQAVLHGEYPSRPFAQDIPVGTPLRHRPYSLFDFSAKTLKVSNESALSLVAQTISPASATCSVEAATTTFAATSAPLAADTDYPADYQSSLSSWKSTWDAYWSTEDAASTTTPAVTLQSAGATPTPVCHSPPSGLSSPPQATASALVEAFCKDSRVSGKLLSNEEPYVDFPYQANGFNGLLQFMASWKPTGCGGWATIDTPTCTSMLNNVLNGCKDSPGNISSGCVVYSYDVTAEQAPNPSIPKEYISRGTFSCVDT